MSFPPIIGSQTLWYVLSKNRDLCDEVAKELEIETDGGDDAGAFVQNVAAEITRNYKNVRINKQIAELRKELS